MKGKFIVIEGTDGAGTTTQAKLLADALHKRGWPSLYTCEPTDGHIGRLIRRALRKEVTLGWESLALLFAADRMEHALAIRSTLEDGIHVVSDRYVLSNLIYQSLSAAPYPEDFARLWIRALNERAPAPDVTIVIDVVPSVAKARRQARQGAKEIFDRDDFQREVSLRYVMANEAGVRHVDGKAEIDEVHREIFAEVMRLFERSAP